jgi:2-oxoadipate dioxygenase/decarboxylase-like protein
LTKIDQTWQSTNRDGEEIMKTNEAVLQAVLDELTGKERAQRLFQVLTIEPELLHEKGKYLSQVAMAQTLNMLLFEDLMERVPDAKSYVADCLRDGKKVMHDHGAVRTVALEGMGGLPAGQEAITRILRPLGYVLNGTYPLDRLKMTGRSYAQMDHPEEIAQFFVSELYPDRFSMEFQAAVRRVTATSVDPLTPDAKSQLAELEETRSLAIDKAVKLLPLLVGCFRRQHSEPTSTDYGILLKESPEMAWIATEGNAFNHATDRVPDVDQLAEEQKQLGRPMKATVETSQSGRVRQTAYLAARVQRRFRAEDGSLVEKEVPGSFYEFITRLPLPETKEGKRLLDLSFDSSNAQAIFKVTTNAS